MADPILYILDVGHGNAAVLVASGKVLVIDAGAGSTLLEALQALKIKRVDVALISHADFDHVAGLQSLMEETSLEIGLVRLNTDSIKTSKTWRDILHELDGRPTMTLEPSLTTSQTGQLDMGEVRVEIVAPAPALAGLGPGQRDFEDRRMSGNSMSVVVRILWKGQAVALLPGDVDDVGLSNAVERCADLSAPFAVFPHHGGLPGQKVPPGKFAENFCNHVKPSTVVFSIGRGVHATPHPEVAAAIRRQDPRTRICCTQLSEHCASALPKKGAAHLLPLVARGRDGGRCCAGSIELRFGDPHEMRPAPGEHGTFIGDHAPKALCRI